MSDNLTINNTFVDVFTRIAVAENTFALSSLTLVQGAHTSTLVLDASYDEVPLSKLIPKGYKIKKNVKSLKTSTNNKRITRLAKLWNGACLSFYWEVCTWTIAELLVMSVLELFAIPKYYLNCWCEMLYWLQFTHLVLLM